VNEYIDNVDFMKIQDTLGRTCK